MHHGQAFWYGCLASSLFPEVPSNTASSWSQASISSVFFCLVVCSAVVFFSVVHFLMSWSPQPNQTVNSFKKRQNWIISVSPATILGPDTIYFSNILVKLPKFKRWPHVKSPIGPLGSVQSFIQTERQREEIFGGFYTSSAKLHLIIFHWLVLPPYVLPIQWHKNK